MREEGGVGAGEVGEDGAEFGGGGEVVRLRVVGVYYEICFKVRGGVLVGGLKGEGGGEEERVREEGWREGNKEGKKGLPRSAR